MLSIGQCKGPGVDEGLQVIRICRRLVSVKNGPGIYQPVFGGIVFDPNEQSLKLMAVR